MTNIRQFTSFTSKLALGTHRGASLIEISKCSEWPTQTVQRILNTAEVSREIGFPLLNHSAFVNICLSKCSLFNQFFFFFVCICKKHICQSFWTANKTKEFWFFGQRLLEMLHCSMYQCLTLDLCVVCVAAHKSNYTHVFHLCLITPPPLLVHFRRPLPLSSATLSW